MSDDPSNDFDADRANERSSAPTAAAVLEHIVRSIVDQPDEIEVESTDERGTVRLDVRVGRDDFGRVIGRRGWTAQNIRTVVRAAATRDQVGRVDVEFVDD